MSTTQPHTLLRRLVAGLASAAVAGSIAVQASPAVAAPVPQAPAPQAPAGTSTPTRQLPLVAADRAVTVDGVQRRIVAELVPTPASFTMAGMTWTGRTGETTLQVRVRTDGGWQPWQELEADPQASAQEREGAGRAGTDAVWFGPATQVEARVLAAGPTAGITDAKLSLVDSRSMEGDPTAAQPAVRAAATTGMPAQPRIVTRAGWGADESLLSWNGSGCVTATIDSTIKAAIVHHTAGTNSYTASQSASIVRGIYAYHVKDRGWCDVGYNFLVDKYGTIFEGRHGGVANPVHGAHATSWNTDTVGVSVMMDSSKAKQSSEAMNSVANILAWKLAGHYRDPLSKLTLAGTYINRIARHGDVMSTSCPGTNITAYMPTLRQQVASRMTGWQDSPIYRAWVAAGGETGSLGTTAVMERPWNGGRTTTFAKGGIYQTPTGGVWTLSRSTDLRYRSAGAFAALGWPTSGTSFEANGTRSQQRFEKGSIYVSSYGSRLTTGAIDSWIRSHPADFALLGYPVAEATTSSDGVVEQKFERGTLRSSNGQVQVVRDSGLMGDLDGDRRADLLAVTSTGTVTWYPTRSDGTAGTARTGATLSGGPFTWVSQVPDTNGDGTAELVARRSDGTLWAWDGRGEGRYANARQIGRGWQSMRQLNVAPDMNGDRLPEIVGISASQQLMRYSLNSSMTVTSTRQIGANWGAIQHMTTVGDFRGAGVTDILAVTSSGALLDYFGTTSGGLSGSRQVGSGWVGFTRVRSIGDVTGDGRWDLVAQRSTGPAYLYANRQGSWASARVMLGEVSGKGLMA